MSKPRLEPIEIHHPESDGDGEDPGRIGKGARRLGPGIARPPAGGAGPPER